MGSGEDPSGSGAGGAAGGDRACASRFGAVLIAALVPGVFGAMTAAVIAYLRQPG